MRVRLKDVPKEALKSLKKFTPGQVITFTVYGTPLGKPRMTRRDKWAKRPCVTKFWAWADKIRESAGVIPDANDIERLDWVAYFEPPESWPAKRRSAVMGTLHRSKPDRDNLDKGLL